MLKVENVDVYGWEAAIRGMRNPMNSWEKSDSAFMGDVGGQFYIGEDDQNLMRVLANAGSDHGKFLRMINVTMDITAPLYWWKEFDTYKVGTVANSCSTMHKIHEKEFTLDDFSHEHLVKDAVRLLNTTIDCLNQAIDVYNNYDKYVSEGKLDPQITSKKQVWWQMIQLLPSSYNQRRTVQLNYAVLKSIYTARKNHKLDEWRTFCEWIETLPYSELITGAERQMTVGVQDGC